MAPDLKRDDVDYDHGGPKQRGARLDGEMHGEWEFFRRDGSLMRSGEFDEGRQVGTWKTFDRSGDLVSETEFPASDADAQPRFPGGGRLLM